MPMYGGDLLLINKSISGLFQSIVAVEFPVNSACKMFVPHRQATANRISALHFSANGSAACIYQPIGSQTHLRQGRHIDDWWICLALTQLNQLAWTRCRSTLLGPNSLAVTMRVTEQWWEESTPSSPRSPGFLLSLSILCGRCTSRAGEVVWRLFSDGE